MMNWVTVKSNTVKPHLKLSRRITFQIFDELNIKKMGK